MSDLRVTNLRGRTSGSSPNLPDGVVVGAAATFTGNVTIGGTITYDDVTRIDSVGIVTAGGGLFVGRNEGTGTGIAVTITTDGNADFGKSGIITASSYEATSGNVVVTRGTGNQGYYINESGGSTHLSISWSSSASSNYFSGNSSGNYPLTVDDFSIITLKPKSGAVNLDYAESTKLSTTPSGVSITGGITVSGITTVANFDTSGTLVEAFKTHTTAWNSNGNLNISEGNLHYNSTNLGGTGAYLNLISTAGINTDIAVGQAINVTAITAVNASTAFINALRIDGKGTGITTSWIGGSVPTDGGGSAYDTYSFNILKTASETYIVIANQVKTS